MVFSLFLFRRFVPGGFALSLICTHTHVDRDAFVGALSWVEHFIISEFWPVFGKFPT